MSIQSTLGRTLRGKATASYVEPLNLSSTSSYIRPLTLAGPSRPPPPQGAQGTQGANLARDFLFWPQFFNDDESRELLKMGLWKLDRVDSTRKRRRRSVSGSGSNENLASEEGERSSLQDLFEGEYGFEEGHYDSVIHDYRETLLSSLPPSPSSELKSLLSRLYSLIPGLDPEISSDKLPPPKTTTHLLHLSPKGAILPHVDNLEASGSVILGLSLGAERTMRLKHKDGEGGWELRLPSGSVYLQRDSIRYDYEHSILPYGDEGSKWDGRNLDPGHRVSIMIRDAPVRQ